MENNNELISVIVPCYNVEKYVEKCIDSIENQTYRNIEIIAIDDKSTDNTFNILKELENKYKNLQVYQNEINSGLATTRNNGLTKIKGEYVGFIDSDDQITEDYYEKMVEKAIDEDLDIVVADIELVYEGGKSPNLLVRACDKEDINKFNLVNNGLAASACNKIIKKELIIKYPFLDGKVNEDVASIIPCIINADKVGYIDSVKYFYLQRLNSIQNGELTLRRLEMFDSVDVCLDKIKDVPDFDKYKEVIVYHQIALLYLAVITKQMDSLKREELLKVFMERQEKYNLYQNQYIKTFINCQPLFERPFYNKIVSYLKTKDVNLANSEIIKWNDNKIKMKKYKEKTKDVFRKITRRTVINRYIDIDELKKVAKKQSLKKENGIKISVVVPNYNYEDFLLTRLYSILYQTEKIYEIILLDDCSKDGSRKLIDKIVDEISPYIKITKVYNEENSGIAFKQWQKGFELTKGDYVWIAEADDCCKKNLLSNLLKPIRNDKDIYISYADTAFINAWDKIILKTIKPDIDLMKTGHWDKDFVNDGKNEIEKYAFLNCTIANVSSCIIKRDDYKEIFKKIIEYRQAGDWLFYINVMKKGKIAYCSKALNYYRVHGNNVTSTMKKQKHFDEIVRIHNEVRNLIKIESWHEEEFNKRYEFLKKVWNLNEESDN
ncbi:MAG: glycosyltransferase [Clostridia bacterium]|nr:glycosyltransferase [Clostridia bacterium]